MANDRWTILAKPPAPQAPPDEPAEYEKMSDAQRTRFMDLVRQRVRALLADRFQLVIRHEMREQTAYVLTIAKNGPKLKASADQSASAFDQTRPRSDCQPGRADGGLGANPGVR